VIAAEAAALRGLLSVILEYRKVMVSALTTFTTSSFSSSFCLSGSWPPNSADFYREERHSDGSARNFDREAGLRREQICCRLAGIDNGSSWRTASLPRTCTLKSSNPEAVPLSSAEAVPLSSAEAVPLSSLSSSLAVSLFISSDVPDVALEDVEFEGRDKALP